MEFVVTFDIADQSFKTYSMEKWNGHIHDLKWKINFEEDLEEDAYDMSDEEVIERQYGDELFWEKISLDRTKAHASCLCY